MLIYTFVTLNNCYMCWCHVIIMSNYHTSYYAIFYICRITLNTYTMNLDKKVLYRHIVMLQDFANAYRAYSYSKNPKLRLWECRKLRRNCSYSGENSTTFFISGQTLPEIDASFGIFVCDFIMLSENDIKNYISQCKSYGIDIAV